MPGGRSCSIAYFLPCRRILVCPRGMNNPGFLSLYLDSPEAAFAPANLNPTASFRLSIINQKTPGQDYFKGAGLPQRRAEQGTAAVCADFSLSMCYKAAASHQEREEGCALCNWRTKAAGTAMLQERLLCLCGCSSVAGRSLPTPAPA